MHQFFPYFKELICRDEQPTYCRCLWSNFLAENHFFLQKSLQNITICAEQGHPIKIQLFIELAPGYELFANLKVCLHVRFQSLILRFKNAISMHLTAKSNMEIARENAA